MPRPRLCNTAARQQVTCQARVIHCDGPVVSLQVEARDEHELIVRGLHKLRIIRCDRFANRVNGKS